MSTHNEDKKTSVLTKRKLENRSQSEKNLLVGYINPPEKKKGFFRPLKPIDHSQEELYKKELQLQWMANPQSLIDEQNRYKKDKYFYLKKRQQREYLDKIVGKRNKSTL